MAYLYNRRVSGHYQSSCFYLRLVMFRRLDSVSVLMWNLLGWAQSIQVPVYGHQHQHKIAYISQAHHKASARVKTNVSLSV
jgi:hypothetical protein